MVKLLLANFARKNINLDRELLPLCTTLIKFTLAKDLMSRLFDVEEQVEPTDEKPTIDGTDDLESCIAFAESPAVKKSLIF